MNTTQKKPPIVLERDEYDALMKDPLYARRIPIMVEIGRVIVKGEKNAA